MSVFGEALPSNFKVINTPQETGRGGGADTIFNYIFICTRLQFQYFVRFELQVFEMQLSSPCYVPLSVEYPNLTRILFQNSLCF